jgi:hypothetical protein
MLLVALSATVCGSIVLYRRSREFSIRAAVHQAASNAKWKMVASQRASYARYVKTPKVPHDYGRWGPDVREVSPDLINFNEELAAEHESHVASAYRRAARRPWSDPAFPNAMTKQDRDRRWVQRKLDVAKTSDFLNLGASRLSARDFAVLKASTHLRALDLSESAVTDADLAQISGLLELEWIGLSKTAVTDAGLLHLRGLKKLKRLELDGAKVTKAGRKMLAASLPEVTMYYDPD